MVGTSSPRRSAAGSRNINAAQPSIVKNIVPISTFMIRSKPANPPAATSAPPARA
jgi:hypothetical protein